MRRNWCPTFLADNVFVAVDILERTGNGYSMIEVKSSTQLKDEHLPDAAEASTTSGRFWQT